ncbi:xanthine dehydrogenase family protein subunit M, partial [Mesorhizobium sp. M7A.F.Ca.CA.002.09.1.1]|uniref:FAD binding domain-containing protein n=1 Tax=Mesorhizobium sp. M7A.F.Ca.CA.002.09.1.1 TaxID=2496739 RepID=UPI000FD60666
MRDFSYVRANSLDAARQAAALPGAMLLAGGTTLIDLAKCGVAEPETLVDITHLKGLGRIEVNERGVTLGALARLRHAAPPAALKSSFPAIPEALW